MNSQLVHHVMQSVIDAGVREVCVAPGKRNAAFVYALAYAKGLKVYYWPEERSAAFFALGRVRATGRPAAIITTSGTAAAQLLPAAMEAYYTNLPLLLITADRPRRLRGTGAPQCAEQVGLFSYYARYMQDIAQSEVCKLEKWSLNGPAHLNVCFEEPDDEACRVLCRDAFNYETRMVKKNETGPWSLSLFNEFLTDVHFPLVILGAIEPRDREAVMKFLLRFKAPIYAEGPSGLRENKCLDRWMVNSDRIWQNSAGHGYSIDGVLRIGSIPTSRIWRDLDEKCGAVKVCSITELPFSGLSWVEGIYAPLKDFFCAVEKIDINRIYPCREWINAEKEREKKLVGLFYDEPSAEASFFYHLSKQIPEQSLVYLGNSLPVREWDLAAVKKQKNLNVMVSRGLCGIDGQISTFLGLCAQHQENWGLIGDLTALFDMAAPWVLQQLSGLNVNLVVINNGGGQIFSRMFEHPAFLNEHNLNFEPLANFWNWNYERWEAVPTKIKSSEGGRLIEFVPDPQATLRLSARIEAL